MKSPFIRKFKTKENNYVYDANTNEIFRVDETVYSILNYIYEDSREKVCSKARCEHSQCEVEQAIRSIGEFRAKEGVFASMRPSYLIFYDKEEIGEKLRSELNNITLIVTERCNMRCRYCVYSGVYHYERMHSEAVMPESIAYKAIDFLFEHSIKSNEITLGFYGGEPLLNMSLIKKCVEYAKKRNAKIHKELDFLITTNGTLLGDREIDFLVENRIGLAVSIDGPEEIHDRYRIYPSGEGTYRRIINNLFRIKEKSGDYFRTRVALNIVLAPQYQLSKIERWFTENDELLGKKKIMVNLVIPFNNDFFKNNNFDLKKEYLSFLPQERHLLDRYIEFVSKGKNPSGFLRSLFEQDFKNIHLRRKYKKFEREFRMNHLCIPGLRWLMVDVKGKFHFCPNISSNMEIGDISVGFDIDRIDSLISDFLEISRECLDCWAIRLCNKSCYLTAAKGDIFDKIQKKRVCKNIKIEIEKILVEYCKLLERNPRIFDELFDSENKSKK